MLLKLKLKVLKFHKDFLATGPIVLWEILLESYDNEMCLLSSFLTFIAG